jgi:hypothetical protein
VTGKFKIPTVAFVKVPARSSYETCPDNLANLGFVKPNAVFERIITIGPTQEIDTDAEGNQRIRTIGQSSRGWRITLDASDIIALVSGLIALIFAILIVAGVMPLNGLTLSVITFTAVAPALSHLVKVVKKES